MTSLSTGILTMRFLGHSTMAPSGRSVSTVLPFLSVYSISISLMYEVFGSRSVRT
ncbi:hypothetical protein LUX33_14630 [Actinomadura madurae]|uniref:hypothetical protein n=1 Tax=Actinomadura madurae TaxID=1993 RepID=UPI0020D23100|nr:hypothetical protein [Actinomadura madurae]MCP9949518.1 hypothetical protein [Actinomadura madurae]